MSETKNKLSKVARLRKRLSDSLGRLACKCWHSSAIIFVLAVTYIHVELIFFLKTALAKEDWSISRTRSQTRLSHMGYRKDHNGLSMRGKAGFSDEYLDKLDSENRDSLQENGDAAGGGVEPDLRWERLRLSDGDLLTASRDPEFEKLKVFSQSLIFISVLIMDYKKNCCSRVLVVLIPVWVVTTPVLKTLAAELQRLKVNKWC